MVFIRSQTSNRPFCETAYYMYSCGCESLYRRPSFINVYGVYDVDPPLNIVDGCEASTQLDVYLCLIVLAGEASSQEDPVVQYVHLIFQNFLSSAKILGLLLDGIFFLPLTMLEFNST